MRRLAHRLLVLATLLVAWLLAKPAMASAPMCDPRAATVLAPSPTLEAPAASIDLGVRDGCGERAALDMRQLSGGRSPAEWPAPQNVDTTLPVQLAAVPPAGVTFACPEAALDRARPGVQSRLDRPPRVL